MALVGGCMKMERSPQRMHLERLTCLLLVSAYEGAALRQEQHLAASAACLDGKIAAHSQILVVVASGRHLCHCHLAGHHRIFQHCTARSSM
jgi:hypothetical protein